LSSTPRNAMGSRQTVSSELTPREFHPSDGLPEPPSLPATVLSRSDCDWTGVPLFSLWVMAKSEAIRYFQSVMNEITPFHRSLLLNRSWRTAAHAYAHHNHKEEVFGGYSVVKDHSRFRHTKQNRWKEFNPSHLFAHLKAVSYRLKLKFFKKFF
jgi:hypothetical protein